MIDQNSQFMAILTNVGAAKLANANTLGLPWKLTALGVGDANGTDPLPSATQTSLINERRRAPLNQLLIDPVNPAVIIAEQVIPADVGGWWIREMGLYDEDGDLVAVSNCAPSFKPILSQGSGRTQIVRMNFIVSSTGNIVLKIDPAVVLATREYVDNKTFASLKEKPTTIAGYNLTDVYSKSEVNIFLSGKAAKATTLAGYGILDTYTASEINIFLGGKAAKATTLAGYGILNAYTTSEINIFLEGKAAKATTLGGYGILDCFTKVETQRVVDDAIARIVGGAPEVLDQLAEVAAALGNDPNFATTMMTQLAGKADKSNSLSGYGIDPASLTDAENIDTPNATKPATTWSVLRTIAKRIVQATETIAGIARVSTQDQVNAGADDSTIVTPKKIRFGFTCSLTANGYFIFPTWLLGLTIQWGVAGVTTNAAGTSGVGTFNFPVAFPNACRQIVGAHDNPSVSADNGFAFGFTFNKEVFSVGVRVLTGTASLVGIRWLAIGH